MTTDWTRRTFLGVAGAAIASGTIASAQAAEQASQSKPVKILAVSCSSRKGKTTATALQVCLDAAKAFSPRVEVELLDLAGMKIEDAAALLEPGYVDDFSKVQEKLADPSVAGIIVGSPTYFGAMSALCKAFLERLMVFRKNYALSNKVAGCLAVGSARNGGQELVLQQIQAVLFSQEMILVGDGKPTGHRGATLWNNWQDDITKDEWGIATAKNLGRRVAEVAMLVTR